MTGPPRTFDTLHMGRCGLDLYSNDIGAPFTEIQSFAAYVGGSPTNVCVGARRLGLNTALLTAVGDDLAGDFVLAFLQREGVETAFAPRKPGFRTGAALLAIEPPDRFPLVFYRENCADVQLNLADVAAAPDRRQPRPAAGGHEPEPRAGGDGHGGRRRSLRGPRRPPSSSTWTCAPTSGTTRSRSAWPSGRCFRSSTW